MRTIAEKIHAERYESLQGVLNCFENQDLKQAGEQLQKLSDELTTESPTSAQIQAAFFITALEKRLDQDFERLENLYLLPDEGQQIQMFNFMAQKFPVVRYAQTLVNQAYLEQLKDQSEVTIWDIGIGNGQQMVRLLESLLATGQTLQQVQVIGLDPSQSSLEEAQRKLLALCAAHGLQFQFLGLPKAVEALTQEDWVAIEPVLNRARGNWIANASFALHHINPVEARTEFFSRICAYQPALFCLIEPYADFLTSNFRHRFDNAWHHYGLAFWAIDQIDAPMESRNLLKNVFFGREIIDVVARDEGRIERFETGEMWADRLQKAGFQSNNALRFPDSIPDFEVICIQAFEQFVGLMAQGHPVISILSARPTGAQ